MIIYINKVTVRVFVADNFPYILPYFVTDILSVCELALVAQLVKCSGHFTNHKCHRFNPLHFQDVKPNLIYKVEWCSSQLVP